LRRKLSISDKLVLQRSIRRRALTLLVVLYPSHFGSDDALILVQGLKFFIFGQEIPRSISPNELRRLLPSHAPDSNILEPEHQSLEMAQLILEALKARRAGVQVEKVGHDS
jgi:hypothetical protein